MRWLQTVGMVRWCRIHPDLQENLSGGVGLVSGIFRGIFSMGTAYGFMSRGRPPHSSTDESKGGASDSPLALGDDECDRSLLKAN
jgi:hypothetical protein